MAGDWLKFETATLDKPEVWQIATDLGIDPDAVVGKLLRVWAWFDSHTEEGNAPSVTKAILDRHVGVTGFAEAMIAAGWMIEEPPEGGGEISLPNFDRHNGQTAKRRALTARRVARTKSKSNADTVTESNAASVSDALPREEKRREDLKDPPIPPKGGEGKPGKKPVELIEIPASLDCPRFGDAWAEWIEHRRQIKKKLTPLAAHRQLATLAEWGVDRAVAAIGHSIEQGWQGIFEPKGPQQPAGSARGKLDRTLAELQAFAESGGRS